MNNDSMEIYNNTVEITPVYGSMESFTALAKVCNGYSVGSVGFIIHAMNAITMYDSIPSMGPSIFMYGHFT